jgi:hypothetical protein
MYNGSLPADSRIFLCSSDASFADDNDTRRSSEGFLFLLYGGPVDWRATKQKTVTTSSTEAELLAVSGAAREMMWWERYFNAIGFKTHQDTTIQCDNAQTIRLLLVATPKLQTRLRHINIYSM